MRLATVRCLIFSVLLLLCLPVQAIALPEGMTPEQAYEQGTLLYQQNKYTQARPYLDFATDNGYPAAALMMADTYWTNLFIATKKETEYAEKAAQMGSLLGLYRAGNHRSYSDDSEVWRLEFMSELRRLVDQENALALRLMSVITEDEDDSHEWLVKAAEAGDQFSQHELARRYGMGDGLFIWPGSREKEVERLFKKAANSGYRPAMVDYAYYLEEKGDLTGFQTIVDELVSLGDAEIIRRMAARHHRIEDYVKSAYFYKIYLGSMGAEGRDNGYETNSFFHDQVVENLTPEQLSEVNKDVDKYLSTHTVCFQKNIKEYEYTVESIKQLN